MKSHQDTPTLVCFIYAFHSRASLAEDRCSSFNLVSKLMICKRGSDSEFQFWNTFKSPTPKSEKSENVSDKNFRVKSYRLESLACLRYCLSITTWFLKALCFNFQAKPILIVKYLLKISPPTPKIAVSEKRPITSPA